MGNTDLADAEVLRAPLTALSEEFYRRNSAGGRHRLHSLHALAINMHWQGALNLVQLSPAEVLTFVEELLKCRDDQHITEMRQAGHGFPSMSVKVFDRQVPGTDCPEPPSPGLA